jgi:hypothetical protein
MKRKLFTVVAAAAILGGIGVYALNSTQPAKAARDAAGPQ